MARLKHAQALWKKSLTLLWTFMKRTRSVYDMWPLLWIVYELYVNSMWQVCDMFLKRQLIWDACGMQLKCMWIYIKSIHTEVSGYTSKYAGNYMYAAKHSKRLFFNSAEVLFCFLHQIFFPLDWNWHMFSSVLNNNRF
jgi:hypothetical protein